MRKVLSQRKLLKEFCLLSQKLLRLANKGISRGEFLREVTVMLLKFSGCDMCEVRKKEESLSYHFEIKLYPEEVFSFKKCKDNFLYFNDGSELDRFYREIYTGDFKPSLPSLTETGRFWTGDLNKPVVINSKTNCKEKIFRLISGEGYRSLLLLPFIVDGKDRGFLCLKSIEPDHFQKGEIEFYEEVAKTFGVAVSDRRAQAALCERIKELTCLYGISQVIQKTGSSFEKILQDIVDLLPQAFQYPETAVSRIFIDGKSYTSRRFRENEYKLKGDIAIKGNVKGFVEVAYSEDPYEPEDGPFLKEEQHLIDEVARKVSLLIEGKMADEEKARLQEQLRHADRLATIGELASGVAHELNEPMGNILGFAQLAKKNPELSEQTEKDLEKIIKASLHSREVIKKLLLFARRIPARKTQVNLNQLVTDGLFFLESRCKKEGIDLEHVLSPELPDITADPSQLNQILVNLVVNSIQALPDGGKITIETFSRGSHVFLVVKDNGIGMSKEVIKKIFIPFFTTKESVKGTGLGLSVVHGIATSHGGSIKVESKIGHGTSFEIKLPVSNV